MTPGHGGANASAAAGDDSPRRAYYLTVLHEITRELSRPRPLRDTVAAFLPLVMGPLGATFAYVVLNDVSEGECLAVSRGLSPHAAARLEESCTQLAGRFFVEQVPDTERTMPAVLAGSHLEQDPHLPSGTMAVAGLPVSDTFQGLFGLGPRLTGEIPGDEEKRLLADSLQGLVLALQNANKARTIDRLNLDLTERNRELAASLDEVSAARDELDRRAFSFQTLYDATRDLAGLTEVQSVLDAALLEFLAAFAAGSGFILLLGPGETEPRTAWRGLDEEDKARLADPGIRERVLSLFVSLKDRMPRTMRSHLVNDPAFAADLPGAPSAVLLFTLDETTRGVACFGPRIAERPLDESQRGVIFSLASTVMMTLSGALRFETIERLNSELTRRNRELTRTLEELTSAKVEIDGLTRAKERITGLIQGEMRRAGSARWYDYVLIMLLSLALALVYNFANPSGIRIVSKLWLEPVAQTINAQTAAVAVAEGAVLVDARPPEFYAAGHAQGALNLPATLFDFVYSMKLAKTPADTPFVVYGRTVSRRYDLQIAHKLKLLGHTPLLLEGGLDVWREHGLPVAGGRP